MEQFTSSEGIIALITLTIMEIVLGIDNIVFLAILAGKLPESQRARARSVGLMAAMAMRLLLLFSITWIMSLKAPLFSLELGAYAHTFSWKDLILVGGGLFLLGKATYEIHHKLEAAEESHATPKVGSFFSVIVQIMIIDIVFSLDSVITAVGMAGDRFWVMVAAIIISVSVMLAFAGPVNRFIDRHPTVKMLALSFLLLIGTMLVVEGGGGHVSKGYIYFAMGFSLFVEMLNIRLRKSVPVKLHT